MIWNNNFSSKLSTPNFSSSLLTKTVPCLCQASIDLMDILVMMEWEIPEIVFRNIHHKYQVIRKIAQQTLTIIVFKIARFHCSCLAFILFKGIASIVFNCSLICHLITGKTRRILYSPFKILRSQGQQETLTWWNITMTPLANLNPISYF